MYYGTKQRTIDTAQNSINILRNSSKGSYHNDRLKAGKLCGGISDHSLREDTYRQLVEMSMAISHEHKDSVAILNKELRALESGYHLGLGSPICQSDYQPQSYQAKQSNKQEQIRVGKNILERLIESEPDATADTLLELSSVKIDWTPQEDTEQLMIRVFQPKDFLFIVNKTYDTGRQYVKQSDEWREQFSKTKTSQFFMRPRLPSFICPNPLTGQIALTADGKESFRCDNAVKDFRFCVLESDKIPLEKQFKLTVRLIKEGWPIATVIFSGGKSLHLWLEVNVTSLEQWNDEVKPLYTEVFVPLGFDGANSNPCRLSRLAGSFRHEKEKWQRLLYLDTTFANNNN